MVPSQDAKLMSPKQKPPPTRVVTLAGTKGGLGKSTLACSLAIRATEDGGKVALLDLDPQQSLTGWWMRRGKTRNPKLYELDATTEAVELLISEGWRHVFIDTPPANIQRIEPGIACADLVLIPTAPNAFDIEQVPLTVELCERQGKRHAVIFNRVPPSSAKLLKSSKQFLRSEGCNVLEESIGFRQHYMAALTQGKAGHELDKGTTVRAEVDTLWQSILKLLSEAS
jgi:chromosome partitioning protein